MKILKAMLRETPTMFPSRALAADKGHDMTYEAGVLSVKSDGKVFLFPASNVVVMEADEAPKKK